MSDSEKLYDLAQRVDALVSSGGALFGPWTQWSLSGSWAVRSPFTHAWVRAAPGGMAILSLWATVGTADDGTIIGTIPAQDADGNGLRPAGYVQVPMALEWLRLPGTTNSEGAYFQIAANGNVTCYGVANTCTYAGVSAGWYPLDSM